MDYASFVMGFDNFEEPCELDFTTSLSSADDISPKPIESFTPSPSFPIEDSHLTFPEQTVIPIVFIADRRIRI
jgi:hypothetical protein